MGWFEGIDEAIDFWTSIREGMLESELLHAVRQWNEAHSHLPFLIATNSRIRLVARDPTSRIPNGFIVSSDKREEIPEEIFELLSPNDVVQRLAECKAKYKSEGEVEEEKERQQSGEKVAPDDSEGELYTIKQSLLAVYREMLRESKYAGLKRIYIINPFRREWAVLTQRHAQPIQRAQAESNVRQRNKRENDGANGESVGLLTEVDDLERGLEVSSTTRTLNADDGSDYFAPLLWHASDRLVMAAAPYAALDLMRIYDAEQYVTREDLEWAPSQAIRELFGEDGSESLYAPVRQSAVNMPQMRQAVEREYSRGFWRGLFSGGLTLALLLVITLATRVYSPEGTLVNWVQSEYLGGSFSLTLLLAGLLCFAFSPIFLSSRLLVDRCESKPPSLWPRKADLADRSGNVMKAAGSETGDESGSSSVTADHVGLLGQLLAREVKRGFWRGVLTTCGGVALMIVVSWCYGLFSIMHNMA